MRFAVAHRKSSVSSKPRHGRILPPVFLKAHRSFLHPLVGMLVVGGCSVTVQPIRPRNLAAPIATTKTSTSENSNAPRASSLSEAACLDAPPDPVLDPTAKFVLQNGHEQAIMRMATSADGRTLVSAGMDGTIRVWDVRAGILLQKFGTAGFFVYGLSLTADGKRLAYYAPDGTPEGLAIRIVDLDRPSSTRTITPFYGSFELSSDGKKLAIAVDKLMVFDVDTGKQLLDLPLGNKSPMALDVKWDATNTRVAVTAPGDAVIVDTSKGSIVHRLAINNSSLNDVPRNILFTNDHVLIRSAIGTITQYALTPGTPPATLPGRYIDMALTGDQLWVADMISHEVSSFSTPNLKPVKLPTLKAPSAQLITASADQSTIVFATGDNVKGTRIDARDLRTLRPLRTIEGHDSGIGVLAINRTGNALLTGSRIGEIHRWDLQNGTRILPPAERDPTSGPIEQLDYTPDGKMFVETNHSPLVRIHDVHTARTTHTWKPEDSHFVKFAKFIPNTFELITVALDNYYRKPTAPTPLPTKPAKAPTTKPVAPKTRSPIVAPQKITPPPQTFAAPKPHVVIDRWDLSGQLPTHQPSTLGKPWAPRGRRVGETLHDGNHVAMSPRGDQLALEGDEELTVIRLDTGAINWSTPLPVLPYGDTKQREGQFDRGFRWITFSPDSKSVLLSARKLEKNAQGGLTFVPLLLVYDAATGRLKSTHRVNTFGPVAWHNGKVLVGGVRPVVLEAPAMTERGRIQALDNRILSVALHPTRELFIIGGDGGAASFVDGNGNITASLVSTSSGEWISAASDGAYRSSIDGARALAWSFAGPLEGFSFERFAARLDKPHLVAQRLTGEVPPSKLALSRPPQLVVQNDLQNVVQTQDRSLTVMTRASSASRVDRVRAFVDGRPVAEQLVCAREGQAKLEIPLHTGQNRVALVAYDAAGQSSNVQNLDVISSSLLTEQPNLHVVAIGVSRYPNMTPEQQLDYADDDARAVTDAFQHQVGPGKPFAKMFTTLLLDEQVTVKSVENVLTELRSVRPNDLVAVFFAGHGARLGEGEMVFMTHQAKFTRESAQAHGLGWDKIHTSLSQVRGRVLMMLDACHSGHLTTEIVAPNEELARQLAAGDRAGIFVFSAARGSQFSYEVPPTGATGSSRGLELAWGDQKPPPTNRELAGGHGLFTSALLEALTGSAPDRDRSGATEVGELVDYVTERVRSASNGLQTPWVARREMFGEFFVVPAKK